MAVNDPIADMLTRIRNASTARHEMTLVPASKMKVAIARLLHEEGYISHYELVRGSTPQRMIRVFLRYEEGNQPVINGLRRVSKPGLRVYVRKHEAARRRGGVGVSVVSTPQGVMLGREAWRRGVGGELLCYVW